MLRLVAAILLLATPALAAPGTKAAIKADYDTVCNAPERSGALKKSESERMQVIIDYLLKNLKTDEVRNFLGTLGTRMPNERGSALKQAAKDAGYTGSCKFADMAT